MTRSAEPASRTHPLQESLPETRGARRLVSPFRCRIWAQHSRPEEQLTDEACKDLRDSISRNGQHQPALGRPVSNDPDCDIEIICGARRHTVAQSLGRDFLVEVRPMTDAEAFVALYEENLLREGDSPYIRGRLLSRALRSGTYSSQEELGRAFNLSHSAVSRLLTLAHLPAMLVAAFASPEDIRESWGVELFRLWSDEGRRAGMADRARALAGKARRPPAREIYQVLITHPGGRKSHQRAYRNIPVRGSSQAILFHEQDQLERVIYIIPKTILSPTRREAVKRSLIRLLDGDLNRPSERDSRDLSSHSQASHPNSRNHPPWSVRSHNSG
jgi:ParB/RepB/Spo0J family partition protein